VGLIRAFRMIAEHGFYSLQGQQAGGNLSFAPLEHHTLDAEFGLYNVTGFEAGLIYDDKPGNGPPPGGGGIWPPDKPIKPPKPPRRRTVVVRLKKGKEIEFETEEEAKEFLHKLRIEARKQNKPVPAAKIIPSVEVHSEDIIVSPKNDDEEIELILLLL